METKSRGDGWLKLVALVIAAPFTFLALMTLASMLTANVWLQLGLAALAAIALPLWIADRIIVFKGGVEHGRGVTSSVLAGTWSMVPVVVLCLGLGWVSPLLHAEAAILEESPLAPAAKVVRMIALDNTEATDVVEQAIEEAPETQEPEETTGETTEETTVETTASASDDSESEAEAVSEVVTNTPIVSNDARMTPSAVFRRWADSVVAIQVFRGSTELGGGTGFVVARDLVVTNHHVVNSAIASRKRGRHLRVGVQMKDGTWARQVQLLDYDEARDLALLRVDVPGDIPPVTLADDDAIQVGEPAISIGNPYGLDHTLTDGIVSARRMYDGARWIQVSSPISPGNSGGPIFDAHGVVIGVSTRVATTEFRAQNLNLAIPSSDVKTFMERTPEVDTIDFGGGGAESVGTW